MDILDGARRQTRAVAATVCGQLTVELRETSRAHGLEPQLADIRPDMPVDQVPIVLQGLGLDLYCVGFSPQVEVDGHGNRVAVDVLALPGAHTGLVARGLGVLLGGEAACDGDPGGRGVGWPGGAVKPDDGVEVDHATPLVFGDLGVGDPQLRGEGLAAEPGAAVDVVGAAAQQNRLQAPSGVPDGTCRDRDGQRRYSSRRGGRAEACSSQVEAGRFADQRCCAACWAWSGAACRSGVSSGGVCTVTRVPGDSPARHLHGYPSMG
jgi:hypothetical protein